MKRFFALLLILATMLGLCACGKSDPRKALSDMGITNREDQDALIEAANSLYAEDTSNKPKSDAQMEKIYEESRKQYGSRLEGKWIEVTRQNATIDKDVWFEGKSGFRRNFQGNKCTLEEDDNTMDWLVEDGKILVGRNLERGQGERRVAEELELVQVNGIDMLRSTSANGYVWYYVHEDNIEALYNAMYLEVELNAENVRDYYELVEVRQDRFDSFNEKTGEYNKRIFLCNTGYKEGLYCVKSKDVLIEVNYPSFGYTDRSFQDHEAGTVNVKTPGYQEILLVYTNIRTNMEAVVSPEDLTIGRAKGTLKFLRPEFIDHIVENKYHYEIHDVFGNKHVTDGLPTPPSVVNY